jgi:hypothetical protein
MSSASFPMVGREYRRPRSNLVQLAGLGILALVIGNFALHCFCMPAAKNWKNTLTIKALFAGTSSTQLSKAETSASRISSLAADSSTSSDTITEANTWMDCDVRFVAAERQAAKLAELEKEMQAAAAATDFMRAEDLKRQLNSLSQAGPPEAPAPESWLIGGEELFSDFGRFLGTRGFRPEEVAINCETSPNGLADWGSTPCEECSRLVSGGPYGARGLIAPAYPKQDAAAGCLASTQRKLDVDLSEYHSKASGSIGDDSFDASSDPASISFCRVK